MTAARIKKLRKKIRLRRTIRRWRYLLILLALLLIGGAGFAGYWAYEKILNRQAYALVGRAVEDLKNGKVTEARMGVETALRIQPGHPAAARLLARIQAASGQPEQALATFQKLTDERLLTLEDLKLYACLAAQKGETQLADRLTKAIGSHGDPAFPHLLKASTLLSQKKPAEAEAELRAAVAADPNNITRSALLEFLIKNRRPGQSVQEAAAIIQDFSTQDSALGAQALALGLRTGFMTPDKRDEWIEKLRKHPKVEMPGRLLADSAAVARNADSKPQIAVELVEFVKSKPLPDRAAAAQWLTKNGESAKALSLLTLDESIARPESFIAWLDASAAAKNWNKSLAALDRKDNPLRPHITKLFQGLARKQLGQSAESQAAFQESIKDAGNDPVKFAEVTVYLLGVGETGMFEANLAKVAAQPALAPALFEKCQPLVYAKRDANFSLRFLECLANSAPLARDPGFQNDITHQRLLLGKPAPLDFLRKHSSENPDNLSSVATLAFAELKAGNTEAAMRLFDNYGPDVDARSLPPRINAIYAATLAANGKTELARKVASIIPRGSLSQQEAEFLIGRLKATK
ncbi:MAG: tetratricopeptide repeat protein, partial [Verrucomicrobiota bacterium]